MSTVTTHTIRFDHLPDSHTITTALDMLTLYTNANNADKLCLTIRLTSTTDDDTQVSRAPISMFALPKMQPTT